MNGLRVNAQAIPVPIAIRSVRAASHVAWVNELRNSSGAHTHSIPAASASLAWDASSSAVPPIAAIEILSSALTERHPKEGRRGAPPRALPLGRLPLAGALLEAEHDLVPAAGL